MKVLFHLLKKQIKNQKEEMEAILLHQRENLNDWEVKQSKLIRNYLTYFMLFIILFVEILIVILLNV